MCPLANLARQTTTGHGPVVLFEAEVRRYVEGLQNASHRRVSTSRLRRELVLFVPLPVVWTGICGLDGMYG
jgi:hypothetical protein